MNVKKVWKKHDASTRCVPRHHLKRKMQPKINVFRIPRKACGGRGRGGKSPKR